MLAQLGQQRRVPLHAPPQADESGDGLAGQRVGAPHHRRLRHRRMGNQGRLHFHGGNVVAGHQHHVVHPAQQPEIAVPVQLGPVPGEIHPRKPGPVGVDVSLVVPPDGAQHGRPRPFDDQVAAPFPHLVSVIVHHPGGDPRHRVGGAARLGGGDPRQGGDHYGTGFRLPPSVHDGGPPAADVLVIPHPGLRVDGFAHRSQKPQRGQVVPPGKLLPPFHKSPDGGGGGVQLGHPVFGDDGPQAVPFREVGGSLVHHRGGPVGQRPVHDVGVAGHPADVGRAPPDVLIGL